MDSYVMVFTKNNNSMHRSCHFHKALSLTGSVLVACAHFGAHVMGSDIDYTLLHGRGTRSVIFSQNPFWPSAQKLEGSVHATPEISKNTSFQSVLQNGFNLDRRHCILVWYENKSGLSRRGGGRGGRGGRGTWEFSLPHHIQGGILLILFHVFFFPSP